MLGYLIVKAIKYINLWSIPLSDLPGKVWTTIVFIIKTQSHKCYTLLTYFYGN